MPWPSWCSEASLLDTEFRFCPNWAISAVSNPRQPACAASVLRALHTPTLVRLTTHYRGNWRPPLSAHGYDQGTRLHESGPVLSLRSAGHEYFGQWFETYDPKTHDAITGVPGSQVRTWTAIEAAVNDQSRRGYLMQSAAVEIVARTVHVLGKLEPGRNSTKV